MSSSDSKKTWSTVLDVVRNRVDQDEFDTWLKPLHVLEATDQEYRVGVQNQKVQDYVAEYHQQRLEEVLQFVTSRNIRLVFQVSSGNRELFPLGNDRQDFSEEIRSASPGFSPEYRFETFVEGPSNQMALAAARAVAERPGANYNPLFIYGGTGLGKTHLLQAIGHYVLAQNQAAKLLYVTGEDWLNAYIKAAQKHTLEYFRGQFRDKVDLFLVDDVQFFSGKERSQIEFFHTFNALHGAGKQIVLTSDRMPAEIPLLEERLKSRFQWGLIADIKPPMLETRIAILKNKAMKKGYELPHDVLDYVATNISMNVRELESCLARLELEANIRACPIDLKLAKEALKTIIRSRATNVNPERILAVVASFYRLNVEELSSQRRLKSITTPRHIAMYLCRKLTTMSLQEIGSSFGGRNHSTILSSLQKIERQMKMDSDFAATVHDLERKLMKQ